MKTDSSFPSKNNVLRRAGRGCATSNQPKLNCARHRPSPAVASSKVSLWMQLLAWESTSCPDGARKSVSVWHFGFDQHLLTTNSLSLSPWLHVLDVVRVTRRGKQWFAESRLIFFFFPGMSAEEITAQWKLAAQISLVVNESYLPPSQDSEQSPLDSRLTVGTMPVQSWAERVCWG